MLSMKIHFGACWEIKFLFPFLSFYEVPVLVSHPFDAEYCRALIIITLFKVTACPFFTSMVADSKGKVLGLGAPPARLIRDGGERCCSSALHRWRERPDEVAIQLQT